MEICIIKWKEQCQLFFFLCCCYCGSRRTLFFQKIIFGVGFFFFLAVSLLWYFYSCEHTHYYRVSLFFFCCSCWCYFECWRSYFNSFDYVCWSWCWCRDLMCRWIVFMLPKQTISMVVCSLCGCIAIELAFLLPILKARRIYFKSNFILAAFFVSFLYNKCSMHVRYSI